MEGEGGGSRVTYCYKGFGGGVRGQGGRCQDLQVEQRKNIKFLPLSQINFSVFSLYFFKIVSKYPNAIAIYKFMHIYCHNIDYACLLLKVHRGLLLDSRSYISY